MSRNEKFTFTTYITHVDQLLHGHIYYLGYKKNVTRKISILLILPFLDKAKGSNINVTLVTLTVKLILGPIGTDGTQCPGFCPHVCPADHTQCPMTSPNGCMVADSCMPMTYGHDGAQCPGMCPIQCPEDHMHCGGGMDATGCPMPDTCVSMTGKYR